MFSSAKKKKAKKMGDRCKNKGSRNKKEKKKCPTRLLPPPVMLFREWLIDIFTVFLLGKKQRGERRMKVFVWDKEIIKDVLRGREKKKTRK